MQRTAILALCGALWVSNASAQGCDEVGDVVGGFAGAATGYGLITQLGVASNWISAGLYGAGVAVATLTGNFAGETVCSDYREIAERIASIYCIAGEYVCDFVDEVSLSLLRDFQICPSCRPDEIFGVFLLRDDIREDWLRTVERGRGGLPELDVLPRNHVGPLSPTVMDSYFLGQQTGFQRNRSLRNAFGGL